MTWVKICGTTNLEDAVLAADAGADAVGFVFHGKSPRNIDASTARSIVTALPHRVEKVGVFVDQSADEIRSIIVEAGLTAAQLHGEDSIANVLRDGAGRTLAAEKIIVVFSADRMGDGDLFVGREGKEEIFAVLLDSGSAATPGGTGKTFDWKKTRESAQGLSLLVPVIIAGGLTPANVDGAISMFQPFGVDVVSGVEARPGKKDPQKVRAFVQAVRNADEKKTS